MSIDEAIEKAKLNAKVNVEYPTDEMLLQEAEEYAQLADWLEELKEYKEHEFDILKKDGELLYKHGILDGYNKAIDDFVKKAKEHAFKHDKKDITNCVIGFIEFFAEQLKEGEEDGNNE